MMCVLEKEGIGAETRHWEEQNDKRRAGAMVKLIAGQSREWPP